MAMDSVGLQEDDLLALAKLQKEYEDAKQSALAAHPDWDNGTDARPLALGRCANLLQNIFLCGCHERRNLTRKRWWREHVSIAITETGCRVGLVGFNSFLIGTAYVMMFSTIEHSIRVFLRNLCPGACQNGRAHFQSVYRKLLTELDLRRWEPLLDVWSALRNATHNNFQFLPPNGKDLDLTVDGRRFVYADGEHFAADWRLFLWLGARAKDMLVEIIGSQRIVEIAAIADPYPHSVAEHLKLTDRVVLNPPDD